MMNHAMNDSMSLSAAQKQHHSLPQGVRSPVSALSLPNTPRTQSPEFFNDSKVAAKKRASPTAAASKIVSGNGKAKVVGNGRNDGTFRGVTKRAQKWRAQLWFEGRLIVIGSTYTTAEEAARAFDKTAHFLLKDRATLNFPHDIPVYEQNLEGIPPAALNAAIGNHRPKPSSHKQRGPATSPLRQHTQKKRSAVISANHPRAPSTRRAKVSALKRQRQLMHEMDQSDEAFYAQSSACKKRQRQQHDSSNSSEGSDEDFSRSASPHHYHYHPSSAAVPSVEQAAQLMLSFRDTLESQYNPQPRQQQQQAAMMHPYYIQQQAHEHMYFPQQQQYYMYPPQMAQYI